MEVSGLYQFVLLLVLVGMLIGAGLVALTAFANSSAMTTTVVNATNASNNQVFSTTAQAAVNQTVTSISAIPSTWLPLIVTITAISIIIVLVVRSFGGGQR